MELKQVVLIAKVVLISSGLNSGTLPYLNLAEVLLSTFKIKMLKIYLNTMKAVCLLENKTTMTILWLPFEGVWIAGL